MHRTHTQARTPHHAASHVREWAARVKHVLGRLSASGKTKQITGERGPKQTTKSQGHTTAWSHSHAHTQPTRKLQRLGTYYQGNRLLLTHTHTHTHTQTMQHVHARETRVCGYWCNRRLNWYFLAAGKLSGLRPLSRCWDRKASTRVLR